MEDYNSFGRHSALKARRVLERVTRRGGHRALVCRRGARVPAAAALGRRRRDGAPPPCARSCSERTRDRPPAPDIRGHQRADRDGRALEAAQPMTNSSARQPLITGSARAAHRALLRAARDNSLSCKTWQAEAALRMLMNNLDPEVAEDPANLVVYGGRGKAARDWEAFDAIVRALRALEPDETLLVQSGKPVGVVPHPRARAARAHRELATSCRTGRRRSTSTSWGRKGLIMYGQMTAGSWIYIGTQGILQGTYETFAACARAALRRHARGPARRHRGLRRHGRRAAAGGHDERRRVPDRRRRSRRARASALTRATSTRSRDLDAAIDHALECRQPRASAVDRRRCATPSSCSSACSQRGVTPDVLTDQTRAHDRCTATCRAGMSRSRRRIALRERDPARVRRAQP